MNWPIQELSIENIFLDQYNIRTPISNQDQNALIMDMFTNEDAFEIARSYVQNGVFPDEFPIVVQEDEQFIMLEGNRRLAALKALSEPAIVPTWQKKLTELVNPGITEIRVVLAPDRSSALKHIANKHTVNYRLNWKPLRQAYFYKSLLDNGKTLDEISLEFPEHDIPRFMKMLDMHHIAKSMDVHDTLKEKIHDERNFPITTLERLYTDKVVTAFLGIEFNELGRVKGNIPLKEFEKGYKKILEDIATGAIDSRKFNTARQKEDYVNKLPAQFRPNLSKRGSFGASNFTATQAPPASTTAKPAKKSSKRMPVGLFFQSDIPFNISSSTSLRLIYNELSGIDVSTYPNATHDLLRSFLECALVYYFKETGEYSMIEKGSKHNPSLSELLNFIGSDKCKSITDNSIKQIANQIKVDWGQPYSLERMNMRNHNENWASSEKDVRSAWAKLEGLFKLLLSPTK